MNNKFRTALSISGLVTAIACYHYVRIFDSWTEAFAVAADVDWLLTVPLLLIEWILVMGLPAS